jgi:hypothetical protein
MEQLGRSLFIPLPDAIQARWNVQPLFTGGRGAYHMACPIARRLGGDPNDHAATVALEKTALPSRMLD